MEILPLWLDAARNFASNDCWDGRTAGTGPPGGDAGAVIPMSNLAMRQEEPGAGAYDDGYVEWKQWEDGSFAVVSTREACDFAANVRKAGRPVPAGSRVLEIGFGNGVFLGFGRSRGWQMHGTELNPALVERARQNGFAATRTETLAPFRAGEFDMVAAFDVMEHIPLDALPHFLDGVQRVLRPGGLYIARFPNGDSPFGRHLQNGDITHRTAIGSIRARYLATQAGLETVYVGHEVRALWAGMAHTPHRLFAVPMLKLMNGFLNFLISPRDPLPFCSPNLVLIARKPVDVISV
jgi:SAM-dependent methyltransferase